MTREKEERRREEWPPRIPLNFISPVHGGEGQRRLDLKRDEIFLESLDRFLGQSVPIDPPFIAPFIRVHSPILASRINDIVLVEKGFWKPFMIAATTFDFHLMEADRDQPRERRRKNCIKRASYIRFGIGRNCCTFPPNRFLPIKLHAPPTPYFEMYLRRTCSGIVNNLSSRASPCFDPFKCLLTRSVELQ